MSSLHNSQGLRIFAGLLIAGLIFSLYRHTRDSEFSFKMNDTGVSPIPGLEVSLEQTKISPPTIVTTVTNTNSEPVTILIYSSPLDHLVLQLGLLHITLDGASVPMEMSAVQVSRKWPPDNDSLVEIDAGQSQQQEIVLREPIIAMGKLGERVVVRLTGKWTAVWAKKKRSVTKVNLEEAPMGESFSGTFKSNSLDVRVHD